MTTGTVAPTFVLKYLTSCGSIFALVTFVVVVTVVVFNCAELQLPEDGMQKIEITTTARLARIESKRGTLLLIAALVAIVFILSALSPREARRLVKRVS